MDTKEQLEVAKAILLNFISDGREISCDGFGICLNMYRHHFNKPYSFRYYIFPVKNKGHISESECIGLVSRESQGWKYHSGDWGYPVKHDWSYGNWEGTNLTLRIDLMKYIVGKIDLLLEGR